MKFLWWLAEINCLTLFHDCDAVLSDLWIYYSADTLVVLSPRTRCTLHCCSGKGLIWPARVLVKSLSQYVHVMVTINLLVHTHKKLIRSEILDICQDYKFNFVGHRNLNMITSFDSQRIVKQCDPKFLDMRIVILNVVLRVFCDNQLQIM